MNNNNIILKDSPINGKGVFAARDFKKGEVVLEWSSSKYLTRKEFEKLTKSERHYIAVVDDRYIVMKSPEKYVNHSCNPNTNVVGDFDVAVRDIIKGEEITSDYSGCLAKEDSIICNCKNKNCRKIIKGGQ